MGESASLVALLVVGVMEAVWGGLEMAPTAPGQASLSQDIVARTTNLAISGTVLVVAFYRHQAEARRQGAGGRGFGA